MRDAAWRAMLAAYPDHPQVTSSGVELKSSNPVDAFVELRALTDGRSTFRADELDWYMFTVDRKDATVIDLSPVNHLRANLRHDGIVDPDEPSARAAMQRVLRAKEVTGAHPAEEQGIVVCLTPRAAVPRELLKTYEKLLELTF